MASTKNKSPDDQLDHLIEDSNAASQNAPGQTFLNALQALIAPFIHQTVGWHNVDQRSLGPEAGKLIAALKEFIASVVRSQQLTNETKSIEVGLSKEDIEHHVSVLEKQKSNDGGGESQSKRRRKSRLAPISRDKVFKELREHVFNKMPIRLLCFEHLGSGLQVSLVERNSVYTRIEATMRENLHEEELVPRSKTHILHHESEDDIIQRLMSKYAGYAILSHTWLRTTPGEVTYGDWTKGQFNANDAGYRKVVNFCKVAWRDYGLAFGWMDTVCINKDSSSELDESIRSMYNWYERAAVCITYLANTETLTNMHLDPWFTRGWTLQELVAPVVVKFYNRDWNKVLEDAENDNDDAQIQVEIERASTLSWHELWNIHKIPISRRMELGAKRQVTREEDTAYSLMGIFNVSIATAYGEGAERAFSRLLQEILATTDEGVMDVFNFAGDFVSSDNSKVFPASPQTYTSRSTNASKAAAHIVPTEPLMLTHLGLRVSVILMPAILIRDAELPWILTHNSASPVGDFDATVFLHTLHHITLRGTYHLLDEQVTSPNGPIVNDVQAAVSFAVFNFTGDTTTTIYISTTCLAWALKPRREDMVLRMPALRSDKSRYIPTVGPITFSLNSKTTGIKEVYGHKYYEVKADNLSKHGMQLVSMYL